MIGPNRTSRPAAIAPGSTAALAFVAVRIVRIDAALLDAVLLTVARRKLHSLGALLGKLVPIPGQLLLALPQRLSSLFQLRVFLRASLLLQADLSVSSLAVAFAIRASAALTLF